MLNHNYVISTTKFLNRMKSEKKETERLGEKGVLRYFGG
jgi:hypothetical protein